VERRMLRGATAYTLSFVLHAGLLAWMGRSLAWVPAMAQLEWGETIVELAASVDAAEAAEPPAVEIEATEVSLPETPEQPMEVAREAPAVPERQEIPELEVASQVAAPPPPPPAQRNEPKPEPTPAAGPKIRRSDSQVQEALVSAPSSIALPAIAGSEVETPPRKLPTNRAPSYPLDALLAGQEGRVVLRVRIDATGQVASAVVETSSSVPSLDRAAHSTVIGWRFEPARRGNVKVEYEVLVPINFFIRG
jgi:protein TonB